MRATVNPSLLIINEIASPLLASLLALKSNAVVNTLIVTTITGSIIGGMAGFIGAVGIGSTSIPQTILSKGMIAKGYVVVNHDNFDTKKVLPFKGSNSTLNSIYKVIDNPISYTLFKHPKDFAERREEIAYSIMAFYGAVVRGGYEFAFVMPVSWNKIVVFLPDAKMFSNYEKDVKKQGIDFVVSFTKTYDEKQRFSIPRL